MGDGEDPTAYAAWQHGFDEVQFWVDGSNGEPCEDGNQNVYAEPHDNPERDYNLYHMCTFSHAWNSPSVSGTGKAELVEQPIRWENVTSRMLDASLGFLGKRAKEEKP